MSRKPDGYTRRVALIVESAVAPRRRMLGGVARYMREHEPWAIYLKPYGVEKSLRKWLQNWRGDGIIAALAEADTDFPRGCGIPVVDVVGLLKDAGVPLVHANDHAIGRIGAEHLLDRGFRHFGFIEYTGYFWSANRRVGFENAISDSGCEASVVQLPFPGGGGPAFWEQQQTQLADWISRLPKPTGVMACTDLCGQQFLEACIRAGVAVPEDVSVIGADNDDLICNIATPPLSSVIINDEQRGYEAAAMLDRLMSNGKPPRSAVFIEPSGAVSRASTDLLAIDDEALAGALRFVREQACNGITVDDILPIVRISRSVLERRFRKLVGRSINDELIRVRLNQAVELLSRTRLELKEIARRAGFGTASYMGSVFRHRLGRTPGSYRTALRRPADQLARDALAEPVEKARGRRGFTAEPTQSSPTKSPAPTGSLAVVHHKDSGLRRVALVIESAVSPRRRMLAGISRYLQEHGPWAIYLKPFGVDKSLSEWMEDWNGDGVIVDHWMRDRLNEIPIEQHRKNLHKLRIPVVDVAGFLHDETMPLVRANDRSVGRFAAEHLLERGFRNFGFLEYPMFWSKHRGEGFEKVLRENGFDLNIYAVSFPAAGTGGPDFWERQQEGMVRWLLSLPKPVAVLASADLCGQQFLEACLRAGMHVPEEVAVIGADNDELICSIASPPLSSVIIDDERRGYEAAAMLDRLMRGEELPATPVYIEPLGVVSRASTDILAIEDEPLVTALRFIRDRACNGITVQDVLDKTPLSRSVLERRFLKFLGRTVNDEIIRIRINRAVELLCSTQLEIKDIARRCGFASRSYMGAVLRKRLGRTPASYRALNSRPRGQLLRDAVPETE